MATALFLLFLAVLAYGLQRNYRPAPRRHPCLAGSTDVDDRDTKRMQSELQLRV